MKLQLIQGWRRKLWRLTSVQAATLLALLSVLQAEVLPQLETAVPAKWWPWVTAGFAVAIVVLRLIAQPSLDTPPAVEVDA